MKKYPMRKLSESCHIETYKIYSPSTRGKILLSECILIIL